MKKPKVYIKSFGCPSGRFWASELKWKLLEKGYDILEQGEQGRLDLKDPLGYISKTDVCIFYSCVILKFCEAQIIDFIRSIKKRNPEIEILITGCAAEYPAALVKETAEVDHILPDQNKIIEYLTKKYGLTRNKKIRKIDTKKELLIKSQCDKFCTYCIESHIRRKEKSFIQSFSYDAIVQRAIKKEKDGCREISLVGICISDWRDRAAKKDLSDLLSRILTKTKLTLSNLELYPSDISDRFIKILKNPRIKGTLSLPIQSGSDRILKLMNRTYDISELRILFEKITSARPDIEIMTDVIVGFPTETRNDFLDTVHILESLPFSRVNIMRYVPRAGTAASKMPKQIPEHIKLNRLKYIVKILKKGGKKVVLRDFSDDNEKNLCDTPAISSLNS